MRPKIATLKPRIATLDTRRGAPIAVERIVGRELQRIRERIALRDGYICQICGRAAGPRQGVVDHRVPLYAGGQETDGNRQWIHDEPCHRLKSEREEKERGR